MNRALNIAMKSVGKVMNYALNHFASKSNKLKKVIAKLIIPSLVKELHKCYSSLYIIQSSKSLSETMSVHGHSLHPRELIFGMGDQ